MSAPKCEVKQDGGWVELFVPSAYRAQISAVFQKPDKDLALALQLSTRGGFIFSTESGSSKSDKSANLKWPVTTTIIPQATDVLLDLAIAQTGRRSSGQWEGEPLSDNRISRVYNLAFEKLVQAGPNFDWTVGELHPLLENLGTDTNQDYFSYHALVAESSRPLHNLASIIIIHVWKCNNLQYEIESPPVSPTESTPPDFPYPATEMDHELPSPDTISPTASAFPDRHISAEPVKLSALERLGSILRPRAASGPSGKKLKRADSALKRSSLAVKELRGDANTDPQSSGMAPMEDATPRSHGHCIFILKLHASKESTSAVSRKSILSRGENPPESSDVSAPLARLREIPGFHPSPIQAVISGEETALTGATDIEPEQEERHVKGPPLGSLRAFAPSGQKPPPPSTSHPQQFASVEEQVMTPSQIDRTVTQALARFTNQFSTRLH